MQRIEERVLDYVNRFRMIEEDFFTSNQPLKGAALLNHPENNFLCSKKLGWFKKYDFYRLFSYLFADKKIK